MTVFGDRVASAVDATAARWIAPRLGEFGTVGGVVPTGFVRYVLVRHPLPGTGRGPADDVAVVAALADVAMRHTTTPNLAWFAIWEGYGWPGSMGAARLHAVGHRRRLSRLVDARERRRRLKADRREAQALRQTLGDIPQFDLPHRRYYLLSGPVDSVSRIASPNGFGLQIPDLWWPDDHSWFVGSDTDLDWTYVGGTEGLVADVLRAFPDQARPVELTAANAAFFPSE